MRSLGPTLAVICTVVAVPASAQIVGGEETEGFEATVALLQDLGGGSATRFCSGTLIRPDVILTAAHCFAYTPDLVYFGSNPFEPGGFFVNGASSLAHPNWDGSVNGPRTPTSASSSSASRSPAYPRCRSGATT